MDNGTEVQKQILRSLREFYPIKVDEIVMAAAVQKLMKEVSADQISRDLRELRDKGLIEESAVRAPFGKTDTYRFKISPGRHRIPAVHGGEGAPGPRRLGQGDRGPPGGDLRPHQGRHGIDAAEPGELPEGLREGNGGGAFQHSRS